MEVKVEDKKGNLVLENRKKLSITGVNEVVSFNDETIILNTNLGALTVRGSGLKMNKLDVENGDMKITGTINSFAYTGSKNRKNNESIIARLFR
ncbi:MULTISPECIES: sporulation protein YabP [Clostridium]|jgi:sporulation protein YabP|uniref:sporulation protein YabP n=1 Tax=Clostridium TaxID=1485 RepID=UPI000289F994|nr:MULTISPECIES: sporulation protein YabP [Clostridium]MDF2502968.1 sporulation protein YabP [Clostridium sp.]